MSFLGKDPRRSISASAPPPVGEEREWLKQRLMNKIKPSQPVTPFTTSTTAAAIVRKKRKMSCVTRMKTNFLASMVSMKESFRYVKAALLGLVMKLKAKNEREATGADLISEKMQVEAANEAEKKKKKLYNSM